MKICSIQYTLDKVWSKKTPYSDHPKMAKKRFKYSIFTENGVTWKKSIAVA